MCVVKCNLQARKDEINCNQVELKEARNEFECNVCTIMQCLQEINKNLMRRRLLNPEGVMYGGVTFSPSQASPTLRIPPFPGTSS